jgi:carbamoyltransferase
MKTHTILGISAYYHDSAAAILQDGEIIAAASEDRFTRRKGDATFPHRAVEFCLARLPSRTWRLSASTTSPC